MGSVYHTYGPTLGEESLFGSRLPIINFYIIFNTSINIKIFQKQNHNFASCVVCAAEAERLVDASQVWFGVAGERRLAALRERVLGKEKKASDQPSLSERLAQW